MPPTISATYIMKVRDLLDLLISKDKSARIVVADLHHNQLPIDGIRWNGEASVFEIITTEGADSDLVDDLRKELKDAEQDYAKLEIEKEDLEKRVDEQDEEIDELKKRVEELEGK